MAINIENPGIVNGLQLGDGTTLIELGQQSVDNSLSVTLATDHSAVPIFDPFESSSELKQDILGNPRVGSPLLLLSDVLRYAINDKVWATKVDSNSQGRILFDPNTSASRLSIQNGNFQQTYSSLQTKINFPYQSGRSMDASFGVKFSRGATNENVVIEFGAYDNFDGYGFRILYEGGKDKILLFRRTSSGESSGLLSREQVPYLAGHNDLMDVNAYEEIIEISNSTASGYSIPTNGNRLDGSLNGAVDINGNITNTGYKLSALNTQLSSSNLTMFKIRYSCHGADFWAFAPLQKTPKPGMPRWVRMHTIPVGDNLSFPALKNTDKPITFRIYRRADRTGANVPSANAFISTFDVSFSVDAGDPSPMDIFSANSATIELTDANITPILGINIKPFIKSGTNTLTGSSVDIPNQLRAFPLSLSCSSTEPTSFYLIKNPTITGNAFPPPADGDLSAVAVASTLGTYTANTGKILGAFYTGQMDATTIDLTNIFSYNREYLAREAQSAANSPGDSLYVMARRLGSITSGATASLVWGQQ